VSIGCQLNNAKFERSKNAAANILALQRTTLQAYFCPLSEGHCQVNFCRMGGNRELIRCFD
jgi:hypothetical protein